MALECHEVGYDESVLRNADLLVSRADDSRLMACVLGHAKEGVVQSQSLKLGYELELNGEESHRTVETYQDCKAPFQLREKGFVFPGVLLVSVKIEVELFRYPILDIRMSNEEKHAKG